MLNKSICKKCKEKYSNWSNESEEIWDSGFVWCPLYVRHKITKIDKLPPDNCKYYLEQLVQC